MKQTRPTNIAEQKVSRIDTHNVKQSNDKPSEPHSFEMDFSGIWTKYADVCFHHQRV